MPLFDVVLAKNGQPIDRKPDANGTVLCGRRIFPIFWAPSAGRSITLHEELVPFVSNSGIIKVDRAAGRGQAGADLRRAVDQIRKRWRGGCVRDPGPANLLSLLVGARHAMRVAATPLGSEAIRSRLGPFQDAAWSGAFHMPVGTLPRIRC